MRTRFLRLARRRGAVVVLVALLLIPVFGFAAFAVDVGRICLVKSQLQIAADAAALAGARVSGDPATTRSNAIAVAALNFADSKSVSINGGNVELGTWDDTSAKFTKLTGSAETSANAVRVTCSRTTGLNNATPLFFAPLIGHNTADLTVSSIAKMKPGRCGLIIGLAYVTMSSTSHTDSYKSAIGSYNAATAGSEGHVCSNGTISMSGSAAIHGDAHPGPGCTVNSSSSVGVLGKIAPLTKALSFAAADPGNAATVNDNAKIPKSSYGKVAVDSKGNFTLSGGDSVTFCPGRTTSPSSPSREVPTSRSPERRRSTPRATSPSAAARSPTRRPCPRTCNSSRWARSATFRVRATSMRWYTVRKRPSPAAARPISTAL